jgi:hypothetical protein
VTRSAEKERLADRNNINLSRSWGNATSDCGEQISALPSVHLEQGSALSIPPVSTTYITATQGFVNGRAEMTNFSYTPRQYPEKRRWYHLFAITA